jgi:hypothetical protein
MSYGIIRAWKSASEYERVEQFLYAIIESDREYLVENCAADIEFTDLVANATLKGVDQLVQHLKTNWNLPKGSFEVTDIEMSYADKSESASFILKTDSNEVVGLLVIEESNGRLSNCKLALSRPE